MIDNNCVYPSLHNNSYADSNISGYRYGDVFVEKTTSGEGIACSRYANCYIGCSCNTSNGWYSSCQGTDCKSVTDTRYTGVNAMSVSNVGDVTSLTDGVSTQSAGGNIQVVSLSGGVSTMSSSGATTCYKKKTCSEGGYYSSVPADQKCSSKSYNGYTCYTSCSYKTCTDYNSSYKSSIPSGQTCTPVEPRDGLTCYKDCKDDYFTATIELQLEIIDKDTGQLINSDSFCGFDHLMFIDDQGRYQGHLYGHDWEGDANGHYVKGVSVTEITFKDAENPIITFPYLEIQSTWTCGVYTTMCRPEYGGSLTTSGLILVKAEERGAFIDYKYKVIDTHPIISVVYGCAVSKNGEWVN